MPELSPETSATGTAQPNELEQRSLTPLVIKVVVTVIAVVALVAYCKSVFDTMQVRHEYNVITTLMDQGHYEAAITGYRSLEPRVDEDLRTQLHENLALCYVAVARTFPEGKERQRDYLTTAWNLDPDALEEAELVLVNR